MLEINKMLYLFITVISEVFFLLEFVSNFIKNVLLLIIIFSYSDRELILLKLEITYKILSNILNVIIYSFFFLILQFSTTCSFIRHACLLFEMLQTFYFEGIIKREELQSNIFMSHLKVCICL